MRLLNTLKFSGKFSCCHILIEYLEICWRIFDKSIFVTFWFNAQKKIVAKPRMMYFDHSTFDQKGESFFRGHHLHCPLFAQSIFSFCLVSFSFDLPPNYLLITKFFSDIIINFYQPEKILRGKITTKKSKIHGGLLCNK